MKYYSHFDRSASMRLPRFRALWPLMWVVSLTGIIVSGCAHQRLSETGASGVEDSRIATIYKASSTNAESSEQSNNKEATDEIAQLDGLSVLLATDQYIPQAVLNSAGYSPSYQAKKNPYLTSRRVIEQSSVLSFIKARRAFKAKHYDLATTLLHELTQSDSSLAGPWVMLGKIAAEQGDLDKAVELYSNALSINANNVNGYIGLAKAQRQKGDFVQAQNTYAQALSVWRDFPEAHLNLGILYDNYLNYPEKGQQHMEAYQFLTKGRNKQANQWLSELKQRTGITKSYIAIQPDNESAVQSSLRRVASSTKK